MPNFLKKISCAMAGTLHRIKEYIDHKGISMRAFEASTGLSNGSFASQLKNDKTIGVDRLENILRVYSDINIEWLLTGEGEMLKQDQARIQRLDHPKAIEAIHETQTVNLYDFEASAGLRTLFDNGKANIIDTIRIPNLPKCDGAIHITGDSMYPILKSGDIVLYKVMPLNIEDIHWGEPYLLSFYEDDTDVAVVVKYIQKSDTKGYIKLASHNQYHAAREIAFVRVNAIAIIKASIRINSMY